MCHRYGMANQFYVHHNKLHRYSRLHHGDCTFCNFGAGIHGRGSSAVVTEWDGPFDTEPAAERAGRRMGHQPTRCTRCMPADR